MMRRMRWVRFGLLMAVVLPGAVAMAAEEPAGERMRTLEIRLYALKPGIRTAFHALVEREALPLLRRAQIDVVAYGPSLHDADSYFLMRAFDSAAARTAAEDAFYGSDAWRRGPRDAVLSMIETYTTVVVGTDEATLRGLREIMSTENRKPSDLNTLLALNEDYVRAVQESDVKRFEEILADDFIATLSDGRLLDRREFLQHTAQPATISKLAVRHVNVRLMGDAAIVHGHATFTSAEGKPGESLYTDVWARRDGKWLAVAAHVTRK
jgi:uncharacterized protein (TIGR02246 family)